MNALEDIGSGKSFLNRAPVAEEPAPGIHRWDYIKLQQKKLSAWLTGSPVVLQIGRRLQGLPRTETIKQKQTDKLANIPIIKTKLMKPMDTAPKKRIVAFIELNIPILYQLKLL